MKTTTIIEVNSKKFREVEIGTIFKSKGHYYIKTQGDKIVNLETGYIFDLPLDEPVQTFSEVEINCY